MSIAVNPIRWLARLLLAAVVALALAPQLASAHTNREHVGPPVSSQAGGSKSANRGETGPAPLAAGLSRPCPGGPGGKCCCGTSPAFPGSGKISLVDSRGWERPVPSRAARSKPSVFEPLLKSLFVFSPALPRAPPAIS
jgi:hypothetical protein